MSLEINHLSGGYTRKKILDDISFSIDNGEIVGLIGLNGAGKSTTIKHIMGLMTPFQGEIKVGGRNIKEDSEAYRSQIGYIPETPLLYRELTLKEHIEVTALSYNITVEEAMDRAQPLLKLFRLEDRIDWFPMDFSKGMKQKVMIMTAFITKPNLLVIDEPFIGLDPLAIGDLIELIQALKNEGASVLMSTHVLGNAEMMCDSYVILHEGKVISKGTIEDLRQNWGMDQASLEEIYRNLAQVKGFRSK